MTLCAPCPFETKVLRFNIWNSNLVHRKETGEQYKIGDQVRATYRLKESGFLCLDELSPTSIDSCPVCYNALESIDTQRMDCNACSIIPSPMQKTRISEEMLLVSCTPKTYMYSTGYRLELLPQDSDKPFVCVIFPKTLLYSKIPSLVVGNKYNVVAWRQENLLNVLDIFV